ncbi:hypothetical protein ACPYO6_14140 [Georgenia sp. Z1344]|uniref:PIN-like domain-containing protein n=1 Tax=Georgenia sp. Z1344 TaxID=3416706 RepID=UPI003CF349AE
MEVPPAPRYFTDENALGLGLLLHRAGRTDILFPDHPDLPEVPLGTPDTEWMPVIAHRDLIVLSRDRRIRTRPAELRVYWEHGIRSVWIGAKRDLSPSDQVDLFLRHEQRLQRQAVKLGPGPWALSLGATGPRPIRLREPD